MYITKKHMSRRAILKGMGATVALPMLDAMLPAGAVWSNMQGIDDLDVRPGGLQ